MATWLSWSFFLTVNPQAQTTSLNRHSSMCCMQSFLFTGRLHKLQSTGNNTHLRTWSVAVLSVNFAWQWTQSPSSLSKTELANRFLKNPVTFWWHFWHFLSRPCARNCSTQNPQKLWPHGVATSASKIGLSLQKWINFVRGQPNHWTGLRASRRLTKFHTITDFPSQPWNGHVRKRSSMEKPCLRNPRVIM